jgi:hypothetical protein
MKRTRNFVSNFTRSKKPKLIKPKSYAPVKREVVSATHVFNHVLNDPLVDWLKNLSRRGTRSSSVYTEATGFTNFILKKGVEFESKLVEHIREEIGDVVTVSDYITNESCKKAIKLIKEGVPILHSVPVKNKYNSTQGIIDLLVRSDHLNCLVEESALAPDEVVKKAAKLDGPYHYVVVDIKFSTLPLRADGVHLLNAGKFPAYKSQAWIYNQAVGHIQGYTPPYAFILGRRWRCTKSSVTEKSFSCLNKLGRIDYKKVDNIYKEKTRKAINWVREVKRDGRNWSVNPPSRVELYPNMCIDSGKWNVEKRKIADRIGEITDIWHVGVKHRNKALEKGIKSWKDPECTSTALSFRGKRSAIVDKIMAINRQNKDVMWPGKIQSRLYNWHEKTNEVYVDFETLSDMFCGFDSLPRQEKTDMIFMIGVGWEAEGSWKYKCFLCNAANHSEEYRIMDNFNKFISDMGNPKIYYWCAEERFWGAAENRQFDRACIDGDTERKERISDTWKNKKWCDLYKLFYEEPIVIKDSFNFGLKSIAKAMKKHKMINVSLESNCSSGLTAMVKAWECYSTRKDPVDTKLMRDIVKYNEFDCKVMWEIIECFRKHHL